MIPDNSGNPHIGLAIIRRNIDKLSVQGSEVHLTHRGDQQMLIIKGTETFESNSFAWGDDSPKSKVLIEVLQLIGVSVTTELDPECDYAWKDI